MPTNESLGDTVHTTPSGEVVATKAVTNDKAWEGRFLAAARCINRIDDLFEYAFLAYDDPRKLQTRVREILADYTEELIRNG